jgi:DNA-binding HxlR family transcriptional regulator
MGAMRNPRGETGGVAPRTPPPEPGAGPGADLLRAVDRVGDRWVLLIVASLLDGPRRFGDLAEALGVAPNILTSRLRQLADDGVVVARPYSERPVRNTYALTAAGRELADALALLGQWGARRGGRRATEAFHSRCGTALELRPWCPTCDRTVEGDEATSAYEL